MGAFVLPLEACRENRLVGGKAINLARLLAAGFPVPTGFVVTTDAFRSAMGADGSFPSDLPPAVAEAVADAYRVIGSPIVAVRSSATAEDMADASMAGQYETFLDLQGEAAVLDGVAKCWRSIDTPRTRAYLADKHIDLTQVAMAVVVQHLVPSEVAGVLFTANPRNGREDEMLIEASWGLGESVVGALVQPDTLVIDLRTSRVKQAIIADKKTWIEPGSHVQRAVPDAQRRVPCLNSRMVDELRRLGLKVAEHFHSPQDLEWGIHDGRLYLLQSRSITTLATAPERVLDAERAALATALAAGKGPWVRHNISETLPHPTPLTWSVVSRFMSGAGGFGAMYRAVGFEPAKSVQHHGFLRLIAGRAYMDLALGAEMFFADYPFAYDLTRLRANPDAAQDPPSIVTGSPGEMMGVMRRLRSVEEKITAVEGDFDRMLVNKIVPAFRAWCARERAVNLGSLDNAALLALWHDRQTKVMVEFAPQSLMPSVICATAMGKLKLFLEPWCWDEDPVHVAELIASGGEANCTMRAAAGLRDLAEGRIDATTWLAEHGHRAPEEFDLATARWCERPAALTAYAANLKGGADPLAMHRDRVAMAAAKAAELRAAMPAKEQATFDALIDILQRYMRFREDGKHWLMEGYALLRTLALEAGRRLELGDDIFLLDEAEFAEALSTGYAPLALIAQRRQRRQAESRCRLPALITADELPTLGIPPVVQGGNHLHAFAIAAGQGKGPVRIVLSPEHAGELGTGYILVCPSTDPSWTPLFVNAAGLVLERGGALSHGAVVAREMGIPAVVLDGATEQLFEGEVVAVDGDRGGLSRGVDDASPDPAAAVVPTEVVVDPADVSIPRNRLPPPRSPAEARIGTVRNICFVVWATYFALAFWPNDWATDHVYRPTMTLLDLVLWPMVPAVGWPVTVLLFSIMMASLCMVLQKLLTDNRRLLVAKDRAASLRAEAMKLPPDAPRRAALLAAAAPVQWRVMGASFVPLGLLLGPMIMSVFWLTDRIDVHNPPPGTSLQVVARIDGEFTGQIQAICSPGMSVDIDQTAVVQALSPIRATLEALQNRWTRERSLGVQPWALRAAGEVAREATLASLAEYLLHPIPAQELVWTIATPATGDSGEVLLWQKADGATPPTELLARIPLRLGPAVPALPCELVSRPPSPDEFIPVIRPAHGPVQRVVIRPMEAQKQEKKQPFIQPFTRLGWMWDPGWIVFYIAVYLPAMFLCRYILKVA